MSANISSKNSTVFPIIIPTKEGLESIYLYLIKSTDTLTLIDAEHDKSQYWHAPQLGLNKMD